MLTSTQIRTAFLEYFRERGHEIVSSSSLVPIDDPTLLFTNAGMNQFKQVFLGLEQRPYKRAVTSQKCVRAGGKHNDLENVGYTARHHTFFEMLGNFSFGDYFKKDAIHFGWEFLTGVMGLPKDKLYVTVYRDDDEAAELWRDMIGVSPERILRMGEKDNFWSMGETGPCGPCSEILIDRGPGYSCGAADCGIETCGCDRWLELWNLVFMQFNRDESGILTPLPRPSIDTGMGLERIAAVIQNADTNFDTDLFMPIIRLVESLSGKRYGGGEVPVFPFRIIADHGRACTFLVTDGVLPSNEGRGYVLRRILRRAVRYGKAMGIDEPFMHQIVPVIESYMGDTYKDMRTKQDLAMRVIRLEEERFRETLSDGTRLVQHLVDSARASGHNVISGKDAFLLYDTYGFPIDLTEDMAYEAGVKVDRAGFDHAMAEQRERARAARRVKGQEALTALLKQISDVPRTTFTGYSEIETSARVLGIVADGERHKQAGTGERVLVIVDRTPFYAESGGQIGDSGEIVWDGGKVSVETTEQLPDGRVAHIGQISSGILLEGQRVSMAVTAERRRSCMRNHSATHLIHRVLKAVLGEHVNQAGSLVGPDRLRFDFTHFASITDDELAEIENLVNTEILRDLVVSAEDMSIDEARSMGATALFGEKYGDTVRVVSMGDFSMELCGGTHVRRTGEIGLCKILADQSVGAGLRRIEAVTGMGALSYCRHMEQSAAAVASALKVSVDDIGQRVNDLLHRTKEQAKEIESLRIEIMKSQALSLAAQSTDVSGIRFVASIVDLPDIESLRTLGDLIRDRLQPGVVVLASPAGDKVSIIAMASKDAIAMGAHAGRILKEASAEVGGSGGGRPDMAQAGGKDKTRIGQALLKAREVLSEMVRR